MNANDVRKGMIILHNNAPHHVMEVQHRTPGNLRAFVQIRMRNLKSGNSLEERFSSTSTVERVQLDRKDMEVMYRDGDTIHMMDSANYEQFEINADDIGEEITKYLSDGIKVQMEFYEGKPLSVDLPGSMELQVVETEPEIKGGTASSSPKPAVLSNGVTVMVPPFIKVGEKYRINPSEDRYLERAK